MALEQWIELYENKTHTKVETDDGFHLLFLEDKGFCRFKVDFKLEILMAKEICGDGRFWHNKMIEIAKGLNFDKMATFFCRPVKVLFRCNGFKVTKEEDGCIYAEDKNGNKAEAYPYNGVYFVFEYLNRNEEKHV